MQSYPEHHYKTRRSPKGAQNKIVQQAVDEYFKLKVKRAKEEISTAAEQPIIQAPKIESKK